MELSLEGLPLLIVFLLPGFIASYIGENLRPGRKLELTSFELGLMSLGYSLIISCIEGILFTVALPTLGVDLEKLINGPFKTTFSTYPVQVLIGISLWVFLGLVGGYLVGQYDPITSLIDKKLYKSRISPRDIWINIFEEGKNGNAELLILMKNNDIYVGYLKEYDLRPDDNGNREFLISGTYFDPGSETKIKAHHYGETLGKLSAALLNTREVNSIQIIYKPIQQSAVSPHLDSS